MAVNYFAFALLSLSSLVAAQSSVANASSSSASPLPTVDLGYAVHSATLNSSGYPYYNFSNIRYAQPPIGDLRFSPPVKVQSINRTVNDGQQGAICYQASPAWVATATKFLSGTPVANLTQNSTAGTSSIAPPSASSSEDCLFLDVFVPQSIYNAPASHNVSQNNGAPVMVWIYGGGFTGGSKMGSGNPAGLLAQARDDGEPGVIYVSLNYRLGLFGWLSGPTLQANGTANVGLYDQRLALQWVQENIHLFGGDPNKVTVFGESAGGSSIMHQITAFGGRNGSAPFQRAIMQSPGFAPIPGNRQKEDFFQTTLMYASLIAGRQITTVQQLRSLNSTVLYYINAAVVAASNYGQFTFGPVVDGDFVPALPGNLLANGQFDRNVSIMVGHNANEGALFASPFVQNDTTFQTYLSLAFPDATPSTLSYISQTLYPPTFDGSQNYTSQYARVSKVTAEFAFVCNTFYLDTAYHNNTYSYIFSVPPAIHGQDIAFTYYNGDSTINATVARTLQDYLTSFAMNGSPNEPGVPYFPMYSSNATIVNLGLTNFGGLAMDDAANERCNWWQKALYY